MFFVSATQLCVYVCVCVLYQLPLPTCVCVGVRSMPAHYFTLLNAPHLPASSR